MRKVLLILAFALTSCLFSPNEDAESHGYFKLVGRASGCEGGACWDSVILGGGSWHDSIWVPVDLSLWLDAAEDAWMSWPELSDGIQGKEKWRSDRSCWSTRTSMRAGRPCILGRLHKGQR